MAALRVRLANPGYLLKARSSAIRTAFTFARQQQPQHTRLFTSYHALKATSSVSGQPASKDASSMKENAKQEIKKATSDIASVITGGNDPKPVGQVGGSSLGELESSVTSLAGLAGNVPKEAWVFGAAGFLPYLGTSLSTIYLARQAHLAEAAGKNSTIDLDTALALLHHVEMIQVSYGAVILSFLGAIHWGFEFAGYGGGRKGTPRYLLGIAPVLLGWPSLLLPGQLALASQWAAFTGVWYLDSRATARGWTPSWYSTYRFALTAVVGSCIVVTLGASNYYSRDSSLGSAADKLAKKNRAPVNVKHTEDAASPLIEGEVGGEFSAKPAEDAYVMFENEEKKKEKEEKERQEAEEKAKKEAEEKANKAKEEATEKAKAARDKAEGRS